MTNNRKLLELVYLGLKGDLDYSIHNRLEGLIRDMIDNLDTLERMEIKRIEDK